jgi:hypothetical protein
MISCVLFNMTYTPITKLVFVILLFNPIAYRQTLISTPNLEPLSIGPFFFP